jgi:hypothetical protein
MKFFPQTSGQINFLGPALLSGTAKWVGGIKYKMNVGWVEA